MPVRSMISRATGIARSLLTYYGPVWRRRRFKAFYGQFLQVGDLAFDIGAHVGNDTGSDTAKDADPLSPMGAEVE